MVIDWFYTTYMLQSWLSNEEGAAAIEAALLMPIMVSLLAGSYDLGKGLVLSSRTVTSSQIAADLITRDKTVNQADVNDAIAGSKLAYEPFSLREYGIDIVSVEFDSRRSPQILWRETQGMSPNNNALDNINGVGDPGEGMVVVSVQYSYQPVFAKYFVGDIDMLEIAYARGRRSPTVTWN